MTTKSYLEIHNKGLESQFYTDSRFWDCECDHNYIHLKSVEDYCSSCGMDHSECSDSRVNEIDYKIFNVKE